MAYTVGDYWNATKYTLRGLGSLSDGLAASHQIRDSEKALPDWWRSNSGPPIDAPRPALTDQENSTIDYYMHEPPF